MQNSNTQNVTELDFRKKKFRWNTPEICQKNWVFGVFSRFIIRFSWTFAQRCILAIPKIWPSPIFEKKIFSVENDGNMPEIASFADFHLIFSLYTSFPCFYSTKTLLMAISKILHCLIFNKTDFCSRNFLKSPDQPIIAGKRFFLNFSSCIWHYFMKFWTLMQNDNS